MKAIKLIDARKIRESLDDRFRAGARMLVAKAHEKMAARPITAGWALDAILRCDETHAGIHSYLCRASTLRRQSAFLVLSQMDHARPELLASWIKRASGRTDWPDDNPLAIIARGIMCIRVKELVHGVLGTRTQGMVATLSRCGDNALRELSYEMLHLLHEDPKHRARAILLRQEELVTDDLVEVVWHLPAALLRKEALSNIRRWEDIRPIESALRLVRRLHPNLSDEDLRCSLAQIGPRSNLAIWVRRWIDRASYLPPCALPYDGDEHLRPLVSASDMRGAGRNLRNCLGSKVVNVALGRSIYYEYVSHGGAIAEIAALSAGQWLLDDIHGPQNCRPAPQAVRAIRATLQAAGVFLARRFAQERDANDVASLLRIRDLGGSWLDMEVED